MGIFHTKLKKYNEIQFSKNKMYLNNWKIIHPPLYTITKLKTKLVYKNIISIYTLLFTK